MLTTRGERASRLRTFAVVVMITYAADIRHNEVIFVPLFSRVCSSESLHIEKFFIVKKCVYGELIGTWKSFKLFSLNGDVTN